MPELPDLHVYALNLNRRVLDKPITEVSGPRGGALAAAVRGAAITSVERVGKELYFRLSGKTAFSVHLMLSGQFHLSSAAEAAAIKYRLLSLAFDDGTALSVSDPRNLCKVALNPRKGGAPDVLSPKFDRAYLGRVSRDNPWMNIKSFLTCQKIMKGIGNAYADEILYAADLSPESFVGQVPEDALDDLFGAIGAVLTSAIDSILQIAPERIGGEERGFLKVHNPNRTATDDGEAILVKEIDGRKTYYTAKQRRFR
ncbi:MAG: formamidopyrimidine-DNA glycosylase [Clostridiales bacterium]|nr:formamidopyrimidine-DNA glycosylase [Clostridiales bacterium]